MGLFLMNHPVAKIMVYIRPQVLEWTNQMSAETIPSSTHLTTEGTVMTTPGHDISNRSQWPTEGRRIQASSLHLHH
jgi:hypothetical protein